MFSDDIRYAHFCRLFIIGLSKCIDVYGELDRNTLKMKIKNQKEHHMVKRSVTKAQSSIIDAQLVCLVFVYTLWLYFYSI